MRASRPIGAVVCAALLGAWLAGAAPARADTLTIRDSVDDVANYETGAAMDEPRVDISKVRVDHQVRVLEVRIDVAELVPFDDELWETGAFGVQVVLQDADAEEEGLWFWQVVALGGDAAGSLVTFTPDFDFVECETEASIDEGLGQYVLRAGTECLRGMPRALRVGAAAFFDEDPDDEAYEDFAYDQAPDDDELSAPVAFSGSAAVSRLAGPDRIETAIALSGDRFGSGDGEVAVLASGDSFPDALAGAPLATVNRGPLLLTGATGLDGRVLDELQRVLPPGSDVFLLGGTAALSETVANDVRANGFRPRRLAGADRFETAIAVADEIGDHELTLVADGRGFREALIAAAAAAALGGVVVLTDGAVLPAATRDYLANDASRHVAIGKAAEAAPGAEQITAPSAPELAQRVLDRLLPDVSMVAIATQATFADALAGAPHLASLGGGLLLSDSAELSAATSAELTQRSGELREVVLYGGTAALSSAVESSVRAAVSSGS